MLAAPLPIIQTHSYKHLRQQQPYRKKHLILPLKSVIPCDFTDMYTSDLLQQVNEIGRPLFTERPLIDWNINDIRSLLIVEKKQPEWHGIIPQIAERGYRIMVLPLDSTDDEIIDTLVSSDIYKEHQFDYKFLYQTAKYTVEAARQRHAASVSNQDSSELTLTKPEWRNVIENYLLNLACEAQCRIDYKKSCSLIRKQRQQELQLQHYELNSKWHRDCSQSLLKKALLTACSTSPDAPSYLRQQAKAPKRAHLSRNEKQAVWVNVQTKLYSKLGLDWEADELI